MTTEVVAYADKFGALSPADIQGQVVLIQNIMHSIMKKDEHYGVIPGTGTKPSLLKAGAEKLCLTFRLDPQFDVEKDQQGQHLTITSKCTLFHIPSGQRFGSGMGSCSTKESKYAYRQAKKKCPACGQEAIIKGKEEYGGGWVCFKKQGGCGAKFGDGDKEIESQVTGRVPNEDIADQYNTVLKMANKRALVAAVLVTTAASDIFTQDIEDMPQFEQPAPEAPKARAPEAKPKATPADKTAQIVAKFASLNVDAEQLKAMLGKEIHMATKADLEAAWAKAESIKNADFTDAYDQTEQAAL